MEAGAQETKIIGAADVTPATADVSPYERLPLLRDLQRRWSRSAGLQRMLAPPIYAFLFRRRSRPLVRMADRHQAAATVVSGRIVRARSAASAPESEAVEVTNKLTAVSRQSAPSGTAQAADPRDDELRIVQGHPGSAGAVHLARTPGVDRATESDLDEITGGPTADSRHKVSPESRVEPQSEAVPGSGDIAPAGIQPAPRR
ncbi:MAG TPA: hypothetical protein VHB50_03065, partial [Bryobacteraceae bacterium]|nr:hypothetical protein [Bryobacteraceae bacterium]